MYLLSLLLFFAGKSFCLYSLEFSLFRYYCCVCLLFFLPVAVRVLLRLLVISQNNDTRVMFDMILFFPIIYFDIHRMRLGLLLIANTLLRLLLNNEAYSGTLCLRAESALYPRAESALSPRAESALSPRVESALHPRAESPLYPRVERGGLAWVAPKPDLK